VSGEPRVARLSAADRRLLEEARRGHLATATRDGRPHVVPVCYAVLDDATLAFAIDDKPKRPGKTLRRLRNLAENPRFALVVDRWDEEWSRLAFVLVEGRGGLCADEVRRNEAIEALRRRYPQYVGMRLEAGRHPVVELVIERLHRFGDVT